MNLISSSTNAELYEKSEEIRTKYEVANNYIFDRYRTITDMERDLGLILSMSKYDTTFDKTIDYNLNKAFPALVNRILQHGGKQEHINKFIEEINKPNG
jgi:hypothetical protein